jgi:NosR/NirI family nitrous oxide reductase transcriptional regulator
MHGEDKPFFAEVGLYRIPADIGIDPVKPWKLEFLVESNIEGNDKIFYIDYKLHPKYIIQPDGLESVANNNEPIWYAAWESQRLNLNLLFITLGILVLALWKKDTLVKYHYVWKSFRYLFLGWILLWLGFYAGGQVTIINILTWMTAPLLKTSWDVLLSDPILVSLMLFVIVSFVIWGRGVFCGWLCPFGALQELTSKLAQKLKVTQIKLSNKWHLRLWPIKYILLAGLVGTSFYSMASVNIASEIEPFKTAISMKFNREWYFIFYAVLLLFIGLFIERFFCRFLCPLGAVMVVGGKLRIFKSLKRREECGSPCQLCAHDCPINAIKPTGEIIMDECFYCLDCQDLYHDEHKCPPLVKIGKVKARNFKPVFTPNIVG